MSVNHPTILALDFDGVICDGLKEYFQAAWLAYCQIWRSSDPTPPQDLAAQFYRLRPVVETGWEMPVLIRALMMGAQEAEILQNWAAISAATIEDSAARSTNEEKLNALQVSGIVDGIRDQWIASDLTGWLAEHRFYPGVIERLRVLLASPTRCFIISTKEGRFIQQLLQQQGIQLSDRQVYGKEAKRPKSQILTELKTEFGDSSLIWFVEDRLKTLQAVAKQPGLEQVTLFLADWGYNTERDRQWVQESDNVHLLSLAQFSQDFSAWRPS